MKTFDVEICRTTRISVSVQAHDEIEACELMKKYSDTKVGWEELMKPAKYPCRVARTVSAAEAKHEKVNFPYGMMIMIYLNY